jgi:hypothetical protein
MINPHLPNETVDDHACSDSQQACYRVLAAKHRERAAHSMDKEAAGYEALSRAIANFEPHRADAP